MKNLKNKIIIGIAILIFVVGIIVVAVKGFNVDLEYQDTKKIEANIGKSFEKEDKTYERKPRRPEAEL